MNNRYALLFLFFASAAMNAMKNDPLTILDIKTTLKNGNKHVPQIHPCLPSDVTDSIFEYVWPSLKIDLPEYTDSLITDVQDHAKMEQTLPIMAENIIEFRTVNKQFNTCIFTNFSSLFLRQNDKNLFFMRSLEAKVPYFIKSAVAYGANYNAVLPSSGFSALLYATFHNNYPVCKLLISKGADVNLEKQAPKIIHCYKKLFCDFPIQMAISKGDARIVELFAQNGAKLNVRRDNDFSHTLLLDAVHRNDPEIMKVLLKYGTKKDYQNIGGIHGIEIAFNTAKALAWATAEDLLKNKQIVELLNQAFETLDPQERGFCG